MVIDIPRRFTFAAHALVQIMPSLQEYPKRDLFLIVGEWGRLYSFIKYQKSPDTRQPILWRASLSATQSLSRQSYGTLYKSYSLKIKKTERIVYFRSNIPTCIAINKRTRIWPIFTSRTLQVLTIPKFRISRLSRFPQSFWPLVINSGVNQRFAATWPDQN